MQKRSAAPSHVGALTAVLALLSIFPPLATDMYLPAIGMLADDLGASHAATELSLSLFFLGLCVGQLIVGPLIDGFGRKMPLLVGTMLFTVTSAALLLVNDIAIFNALRFLQAIGACVGMVVGRAIVTDLYSGRQAAKVMTLLVMLMTVGPVISPTLGSLLLGAFGWRSIFIAMVLVGLPAFILSKVVVPETLPRNQRTERPFRSAARTGFRLLGQPAFLVPVLVTGLVQSGMFAFITGSSGVFQGVYGMSAIGYGLTFAAIAAALFVFGRINSMLLDRFSPAEVLYWGLPVYGLATLLTVLLSSSPSVWLFVIPLWFAIGMVGLLSANAMSLAMASATSAAGTGSALLGAVQFGMAFAVSSCVALAGTDNALPMSLGLFVPAVAAVVLWAAIGTTPVARDVGHLS